MAATIEELEARLAVLERLVGDVPRIEPDRLYEPEEAAAIIGCGRTNIYNLWLSGDLAKTVIGAGKKGMRVMGSDLTAFLESRKEGGPKPKGSFKYLKPRPVHP